MIAILSKPRLTLHEVAELLRVKEAMVRALIEDGDLRTFEFGSDWRVAVKAMQSFAEAHAHPTH